MSIIGDFVSGRSNKLARDLLAASVVVSGCFVLAGMYLDATTRAFRGLNQQMPDRVAAQAKQQAPKTESYTITRSVLDDAPNATGSIGQSKNAKDKK
jgi:hypothetical protein